jgi:hypothetical protein
LKELVLLYQILQHHFLYLQFRFVLLDLGLVYKFLPRMEHPQVLMRFFLLHHQLYLQENL